MPKRISHSTSIRDFEQPLPAPPLFSAYKEWEGVTVQTFNQPMEAESVIFPTASDVALAVIIQGELALEHRIVGGPWKAFHMGAGEGCLTPAGVEPYELR
jgi:hypothetical protein